MLSALSEGAALLDIITFFNASNVSVPLVRRMFFEHIKERFNDRGINRMKKTKRKGTSQITRCFALCLSTALLVAAVSWLAARAASFPSMETSTDGLSVTGVYTYEGKNLSLNPSIQCPEEPRAVEDFQNVLAYMAIHDLDALNLTYRNPLPENFLADLRRMSSNELYTYRYAHPEYFNYMNLVYFKEVDAAEDGAYVLGVRLFAKGYNSETMIAYRRQALSDAQDVLRSLYDTGKLRPDMSEKKRAKVITEWIVDHTEYDNDETRLCHTAWSVFRRGTAVCDGYVSALQLMLGLEGIQCRGQLGTVKGDETLHLWTIAVLDGEEVGIDPIGCEKNFRYFGMDKPKMDKWYVTKDESQLNQDHA